MGRQAYLTKLALGRSAFEPSQAVGHSSEYIQLASPLQQVPPELRQPNPNRYIQLYDERGNPTNPRASDHGRRLREAQNDVLASIGVVERRRSPSQGLPGPNDARLRQLEEEDTAAGVVAIASTLSTNACTWWVGSLRQRILTFRFEDALPFRQILASERTLSSQSLMYGGFPAWQLSALGFRFGFYFALYVVQVLRPLQRLMRATRASPRTRRFFRRWKGLSALVLRLVLEGLLYPVSHHAYLQRLGLAPVKPLLPSRRSLVPFSKASPLLPLSPFYDASRSTVDFLKALSTSPFVLICLEHMYEQWLQASLQEAIQDSIVRPDSPDMLGVGEAVPNRTLALYGRRPRSPSFLRVVLNKALVAIGWAKPLPSKDKVESDVTTTGQPSGIRSDETVEVGGERLTDIHRLELPLARQDALTITEELDAGAGVIPVNISFPVTPEPPSPASPTATQTSQNENDPRIRITSREGIVEMEVHLPSHVLSAHAAIAGSGRSTPNQHIPITPEAERILDARRRHRVTMLSTEPARMLASICSEQITIWMMLPLQLITLRLIASHYLASQQSHVGPRRVLDLLPPWSDLTWSSVGLIVSRVALCGAVDFVINLGVWGAQYQCVTWLGTKSFGWGTL